MNKILPQSSDEIFSEEFIKRAKYDPTLNRIYHAAQKHKVNLAAILESVALLLVDSQEREKDLLAERDQAWSDFFHTNLIKHNKIAKDFKP